MYCVRCGNKLGDGARFCGRCGSPVDGSLQAGSKHRPQADAVNPSVHRIDHAEPANQRQAHPAPAQQQQAQQQQAHPAPAVAWKPGNPSADSLPEGSALSRKSRNRSHQIAIIGAASAFAIALAGVLVYLGATGSWSLLPWPDDASGSSATGSSNSATVVGKNGEVIKPLARPRLIAPMAVASGASSQADAARQDAQDIKALVSPALASYTQAASGDTSQDGQSQQGASEGEDDGGQNGGGGGDGSSNHNAGDSNSEPGQTQGESDKNQSPVSQDASSVPDYTQNPYANLERYEVEDNLANVVNVDEFHLDDSAKEMLEENLFVVTAPGDYEYFSLYEKNRYTDTPNFVTVDSIMHTYHLYFSHLLKNTESGYLYSKLEAMSRLMLEASEAQAKALAGTEWEDAAKRNMVFFGVALKLLDPEADIPASIAQDVDAELSLINSASEVEGPNLVTSEPEDYTQYKPRGYYEQTEQLSRYFRAMMWYGRTNFLQESLLGGTEDDRVLSRCALLMTLAMRGDGAGKANSDWEAIYAVTSFFAGAADDNGFYEYYPLVQAAYGEEVSIEDLAGNNEAWDYFNDLASQLDPPKISSVIVGVEESVDDDDIRGFRFMGQRFSIDESIYQQLVHDNVKDRMLPSAMDLPAALGSGQAVEILAEEGKSDYPGYDAQLEKVRSEIASSSLDAWTESLYASWLYTLSPLLLEKADSYPAFMVSEEWDRKDLQTFLSSYAELKHDTVLYSKQVMAEMGGGEPRDDRGYVEPEVEVYARLAYLVKATSEGLSSYNVLSDQDKENLAILEELVTQLEGISAKELRGEDLTDEEYELIRSYGGQLEHFWDAVNPEFANGGKTKAMSSPAAVITDIATGTDGVLEVGTGQIADIYVIAPVAGQLKICSGGVPLYYEFVQAGGDRLTDSSWREMLGITYGSTPGSQAPDYVDWVDGYTYKRDGSR